MSDAPRPLELLLTRHAERDLLAIPSEFREQIKRDILRLAHGILPFAQLKKLQGFHPALWQLTCGAYRVIYRRTGEQILLMRVVHKPKQARALRALRWHAAPVIGGTDEVVERSGRIEVQ